MNETINGILGDYLDNGSTDYALLINGPWGCGKSFYVENELRAIIEDRGFAYMYISLNGCTDFSQVRRKITFQLLYGSRKNVTMDDDLIDGLIEMGTELSGKGSAVDVLNTPKVLFERRKPEDIDIRKTVFIFDDLERISETLPHSDLMGAIYENYTRKGGRTIFVTDEANIRDKHYRKIKEKIIRRTVTYQPDFDKQLYSFLTFYFKDKKQAGYLNKKCDVFAAYLKTARIRNLRTIAFILDNYLSIADRIDDKLLYKHGNFIFINIMALTEELKNGRLDTGAPNDTRELEKITAAPVFWELYKKSESEKTYAEKFFERYNREYGLRFIFVRSLFDFVLTGYCDMEALERELKRIFYEENKSDEEKALDTAADFRRIEEDELAAALSRIVAFLREGVYPLARLPYIYSLLRFHEERRYVSEWNYHIEEIISDAFEKAAASADVTPADGSASSTRPASAADAVSGSSVVVGTASNGKGNAAVPETFPVFDERVTDTDYFRALTAKIRGRLEALTVRRRKDEVVNILELVIRDDPKAPGVINAYDRAKFFRDVAEMELFDRFLRLTNRGIAVFESSVCAGSSRDDEDESAVCERKALGDLAASLKEKVPAMSVSRMRAKRFEEFITLLEDVSAGDCE